MKPQKRSSTDYEKLKIGEFITGEIEKVEYDQEHTFKGFQGKEDTIQPAVRFKFRFDGYNFPHYSRWMKFMYAPKANLFVKYVSKLVKDAEPDMDFDLDLLNGVRVKTIWAENGDFQNIENIFPLGEKVDPGVTPTKGQTTEEAWLDEAEPDIN
jgi:hypothetical protein